MSSNVLPPEIMERLQKDYINTFDEKLAGLEKALKESNWLELYNIFHKLAGSGATYYMPEISVLGRHAEKYFKLTSKPNPTVAAECIELIKNIFTARKTGSTLAVDDHPILQKLA